MIHSSELHESVLTSVGILVLFKNRGSSNERNWNDLVSFAVEGSSDVIGGLKHDSASVPSYTALSPSEKKKTPSRSRAVVEKVAPLVDTTEIGGEALSTSINSGEKASTKTDRSFTFDVSPLAAGSAKGEADKSIISSQACQPTEVCFLF